MSSLPSLDSAPVSSSSPAPLPNTGPKECAMCASPFSSTRHVPISCLQCGYTVGKQCWQQWILLCVEEKHQTEVRCMSCAHVKHPTFVYSLGGATWKARYMAKYRETIFDREREALAQLAPFLEQRRQIAALKQQIQDRIPLFQQDATELENFAWKQRYGGSINSYVFSLINAVRDLQKYKWLSISPIHIHPSQFLNTEYSIYNASVRIHTLLEAGNTDVRHIRDLQGADLGMRLHTTSSSSSSTEVKAPVQRVVLCKCSSDQCLGLVYTDTSACSMCGQNVCPKCLEPVPATKDGESTKEETKQQQHACHPDTLATMRVIREGSRNCPRCGTSIFKVDPKTTCNDMFCFHCKTSFNFRTLEIDRRGNTNPESQRYLHSREYRQRNERKTGRSTQQHDDNSDIDEAEWSDIDEDEWSDSDDEDETDQRFGEFWAWPCIQSPASFEIASIQDLETQFVSAMARYRGTWTVLLHDNWRLAYPGCVFLAKGDMAALEKAVVEMDWFRILAMHLEQQTRARFKGLENVDYKRYLLRMRFLEGSIGRDAFQKQTLRFERRYQVELEYDQAVERAIQSLEDTAREFRLLHARLYFDRVRAAIQKLRFSIPESTFTGMFTKGPPDAWSLEALFGNVGPETSVSLFGLQYLPPDRVCWYPFLSARDNKNDTTLQTMVVLTANGGFHQSSTHGTIFINSLRFGTGPNSTEGRNVPLLAHFYRLLESSETYTQQWAETCQKEILPRYNSKTKTHKPQDLSALLACVSKSHAAIEQCNESLRAIAAEHAVQVRFQLKPTLCSTDLLYREDFPSRNKRKKARENADDSSSSDDEEESPKSNTKSTKRPKTTALDRITTH